MEAWEKYEDLMGLGKNDLKFYPEGKRSEGQKQVGKVLVNTWDKLGLIRNNSQKKLGEEDRGSSSEEIWYVDRTCNKPIEIVTFLW